MLSRFGIEASQAAQYVIAFVIILVLVALFGLVLRRLTGGRLLLPGQDRGRARQPRLGIVDIYDLDRQRQLILLRRDNVEHLLLIGGPNDVVIETNIVRAVGARAPVAAPENGLPAADPALDAPPRPQIETNGRPSIEAQLAARLGAFTPRPGEDRAEATPAVAEPVLKPSAVTLAPAPAQAPEPPPPVPLRSAPPRPEPAPQPARPASQPPAAPPPAPPPARPASDAFMPRMTGARPTPAPAAPPNPPAAPPPPRPSQPSTAERNQDAAVLSDMAKQLEEALKRPPAQPAPTPNRVLPALDTPPAPRAAPPRPEPVRAEPPAPEPRREPPRPEPVRADPAPQPARPPEPVRPEPPRPAPAPAPAPATVRPPPPPPPTPPRATPPAPPSPAPPAPQAGQQPRPSDDPFSVDEIEAEFARLLGRPVGGNGKN